MGFDPHGSEVLQSQSWWPVKEEIDELEIFSIDFLLFDRSVRQLRFASLLDPLVQRLQHARIHRSDYVYCRIEFLFRHPGFPCVRKASFDSRVAQSHHRNGQADEHLFAVAETFDSMGVTVEGAKISFLQGMSLLSDSTRSQPENPPFIPLWQRGKEGDLKLET
jgi:hypothetical protein